MTEFGGQGPRGHFRRDCVLPFVLTERRFPLALLLVTSVHHEDIVRGRQVDFFRSKLPHIKLQLKLFLAVSVRDIRVIHSQLIVHVDVRGQGLGRHQRQHILVHTIHAAAELSQFLVKIATGGQTLVGEGHYISVDRLVHRLEAR